MTRCSPPSTSSKGAFPANATCSAGRSPRPTGGCSTLVRFDVAYFSLFRCNKKRIADYPNLSNYMRELYQMPGIAQTVKARYYVINYWSIARLNPVGIIPKGTPVDLTAAHDRARLAS